MANFAMPELDLLSWASSYLQKCHLEPSISTNGEDLILANGQRTHIGLKIKPNKDFKGTPQQFAEPFEKYAQCLSLQLQLKHNQEVFQQENRSISLSAHDSTAAIMERTPTGLSISIWLAFRIHESHHHVPLELGLSLIVTPPLPQHGIFMQNQQRSDPEEQAIRMLLDSHRFQPPRIPPRETSVNLMIVSPVKLSSRCREMTAHSSLVVCTVQNSHPCGALSVVGVILHTSETDEYVRRIEAVEGDPWVVLPAIENSSENGASQGNSASSACSSVCDVRDLGDPDDAFVPGLDRYYSSTSSQDYNSSLSSRTGPGGYAKVRRDGVGKIFEADALFQWVHLHPSSACDLDADANGNGVNSVAANAGNAVPCVVVIQPGESYSFAYTVRVRAQGEAGRGAASRGQLDALGNFLTPITVRWVASNSENSNVQMARLLAPWSMGSGWALSRSECPDADSAQNPDANSSSTLEIVLTGPEQAPCHKPFTVVVRITNTCRQVLGDLVLVPATIAVGPSEMLQTSFICREASVPLKELGPGQSAEVRLTVQPLLIGLLRIDELCVTGGGRSFRPALACVVAINDDRLDDIEL